MRVIGRMVTMTSKEELHQWIDNNIQKLKPSEEERVKMSQDDIEKIHMTYLGELFFIIVQLNYKYHSESKHFETESEKNLSIQHDIKQIDELWCEAMRYMTYNHSIPLTRYGVIIMLKMMKFSDDDITERVHQQVDQYINQLDATISHQYDPNNNPGTLKEYFALLRELETFYQDQSRYDTEEMKQKSARIIELYQNIMGLNRPMI